MDEPRQKTIGITAREKATLERAKHLYENKTGEKTDWGGFLGAVTALGLTVLGIYKLANSTRKNPTTRCPLCRKKFPIAHSGELPAVVYITCPYCEAELVVDFKEP